MKILVLGGSYFLGKTFVNANAKLHEITVVNRGNRPINLDGVKEVVGDRHDAGIFQKIQNEKYDVIIDFCAYDKGDIKQVVENVNDCFKQYIFISTCDVYKRGLNKKLDEQSELEDRSFGGMEGQYIAGKVALEKEISQLSLEKGFAYTSIRPAVIYGMGNYAPRENIYFNWIRNANQIIHPIDATGEFQMAYVCDVARAISLCIGNEKAYNKAYNICNEEMYNYDSWSKLLEVSVPISFEKVSIPVDMVLEKNIPLPFPLFKEESNYYDGSSICQLGFEYTDVVEGMRKTAEAYWEQA